MRSPNCSVRIMMLSAGLMLLCSAQLGYSSQTCVGDPCTGTGQFRTDSNLGVTLKPEATPVRISKKGGSFEYSLTLENKGKTDVQFSLWVEMNLPDGEKFGPVLVNDNLHLAAGSDVQWDAIQEIPPLVPPGAYTFRLMAGIYPNKIVAQDEFSILKGAIE